ncbi:uncharacterized protein LOC141860685 [Acropora palmata]|uniref:uncharacterized protein LOC141860685 n=1 Tax=Acropora palmata TaxID=6131 RepID=UPI003DA11652
MKSVGVEKCQQVRSLKCVSVFASALLVFRLVFAVQTRFPDSEEVLIYFCFQRISSRRSSCEMTTPRDAGHHAPQMLENYGVEGDNLQQAVQETAEGIRTNPYLPIEEESRGTPPSVRRAREYQRDTLQSQSKLCGKFPHFVNRKTDQLFPYCEVS